MYSSGLTSPFFRRVLTDFIESRSSVSGSAASVLRDVLLVFS